ncbi:hypothetical protein EJB05_25607 [Eragrostis curvula]|uniref:Uncharacterized protein n=1 Tax=Eragrostis curvula TaxID=38414 RepID=A0A5J9UIF6_9POAL|nr:hypothetical protein EJB05_25607 [Eragrostis curvula]
MQLEKMNKYASVVHVTVHTQGRSQPCGSPVSASFFVDVINVENQLGFSDPGRTYRSIRDTKHLRYSTSFHHDPAT